VPTPERPTIAAAHRVETIAIEMRRTLGRNLFTAGSPLDRLRPDPSCYESAAQPVLGGIEAANPLSSGEAYEVSVAIPTATEADLNAAGTDYPEAVTRLYLETDGLTDRVAELAREVTAGADDPVRAGQGPRALPLQGSELHLPDDRPRRTARPGPGRPLPLRR
jgi:hypothetical protein